MMSVSKLDYQGERKAVKADEAISVLVDILHSYGCAPEPSSVIAEHLADSDLCGVRIARCDAHPSICPTIQKTAI